MTAIPHPLQAGTTAVLHDELHAHAHVEFSFVKKYIFSTDHKTIGLQFLFVGLMFLAIGGLEGDDHSLAARPGRMGANPTADPRPDTWAGPAGR